MSEAVVARLEAVASRLEAAVARMGGGDVAEGETPPYVADFERFVNTEVKAAIEATNALGIKKVGDFIGTGYGQLLELMKKLPNSKKPSAADFGTYLKPLFDSIAGLDNLRYKAKDFRKFGDHYKSAFELLDGARWVIFEAPNGTPFSHANGALQSTDFNLNRVLKGNKDASTKAFVQAYKKLNKAQESFIKNYFKTGLTWNGKGEPLAAATATSGGGDPADDKKEAAKAPAKKAASSSSSTKSGGGGGMGSVFGELSKGLAVTSGLKKVQKSQKTKYRKDRSGKVQMKSKKKAVRKKGEPKLSYRGGRWMAENHTDTMLEVDKADMKANVYITMGDGSTYQVPNKVKSVTIDSCNKCRVFVSEVISTVEMINCKSTTIIVQKKAQAISVDKSSSPRIILLRPAAECNPDIYTSNIDAMNIEIPGKTDDDDMKEIAIPEQFLTKIDLKTGKATTTEVTHG